MFRRIHRMLNRIGEAESVSILYACETGSRAWDFASPESDYDVRFLYAHTPEWYVSLELEHRRDVIECPIVQNLDIGGWDIRKALRLLSRSNPPLLEWLHSPIVYFDRFCVADRLREIVPVCFSPSICRYHYLHMASGNIRKYLSGETVDLKKLFYILRPLLAVRWLDEGRGLVPVRFIELLDAVVTETEIVDLVRDLLRRKRIGEDLTGSPLIPPLRDFIERELALRKGWETGPPSPQPDAGLLDEVFRDVLDRAWGEPVMTGI